MAAPTEMTVAQLYRRMGLPDQPAIIDVCTAEDFAADPRLVPAAIRRDWRNPESWAAELTGRDVVVVCHKGKKLSQGAAAWLRHVGVAAQSLAGGVVAWRDAGLPMVRTQALPTPDARGRTVWVTRQRPKVDRIACPWLIRRFVDPDAVFLFVAPGEVEAVAERFTATPFDIEGVAWSHRGPLCTFDIMISELGLTHPPLERLATIVRGADTARLDLAPEAAGLLAASLGLSRMYKDDLVQLTQGFALYDAMYRWARDASDETHNWPATGSTPA